MAISKAAARADDSAPTRSSGAGEAPPRRRGMSFRTKLIAMILFVALVPLSVSAFTSLRLQQSAFDAKVTELQKSSADQGSAMVELMLASAVDRFAAIADPIPWAELSDDERAGALVLVYRQHPDAVVVQLSGRDGGGIGEAIFRRRADEHTEHPTASRQLVDSFSEVLTVAQGKPVVGDLFRADGQTLIALAIPAGSLSLSIALSLRTVCADLAANTPDSLSALLIGPNGELACNKADLDGASLARLRSGIGVLEHQQNGELIRSAVTSGSSGFAVAMQQPRADATSLGRALRSRTLFWIGLSLLIALIGGWFLSGEIRSPVAKLAAGANRLADGELSYRIEDLGSDELGSLGKTFNVMSSELQRRDEEIRAWNVELQERVDERTRDLRDAQHQLLETQKLAAVSSLAAGLAHEVNNPLTAVLGLTQVLRRRAEKADNPKSVKALRSIESEAKRIGEIVKTLRSLSRDSEGEGFAGVPFEKLAREAVELSTDILAEADVEIAVEVADDRLPPVRGIEHKLRQMVVELISNGVTASESGDVVTLRMTNHDHKMLRLEVIDSGKGIARENLDRIFEPFFTTKDNWEGKGLGLTVAHRIVTEHRGTIRAESEPDKGSRFVVMLPFARAESQLV